MDKTKKKILVVDDDPALQNLICRFFNYNDFMTESALDGRTARQLLIKFKPDLVILDVNLPDDTGLNYVRKSVKAILLLLC